MASQWRSDPGKDATLSCPGLSGHALQVAIGFTADEPGIGPLSQDNFRIPFDYPKIHAAEDSSSHSFAGDPIAFIGKDRNRPA